MGSAVKEALATDKLVVAVGSFRSEEQRRRFRDIGISSVASVTTVRILCSVETASRRIRSRRAIGERGPNKEAILQIDAALDRANDIDKILTNESSVEEFHGNIDALIQALERGFTNVAGNDG
jgi:hypothetical protein